MFEFHSTIYSFVLPRHLLLRNVLLQPSSGWRNINFRGAAGSGNWGLTSLTYVGVLDLLVQRVLLLGWLWDLICETKYIMIPLWHMYYGNMGCCVFKCKTRMIFASAQNQHTQRKFMIFENWCSGELSKIGHHFSNKVI